MSIRAHWSQAIFLPIWLFCSEGVWAASFFVDEANIGQTLKGVAISIKFNLPVNINTYSPQSQGSLLNIGVQTPSPITDFDPGEVGKVDWLGINEPGHQKLYSSIRFERTSIRAGILVITFRDTTSYTVTMGSDARSVVIQTDIELPADSDGPKVAEDLPDRVDIQDFPEGESRQAELMEEARQAMIASDYARAIQVYTKILYEADLDDINTGQNDIPHGAVSAKRLVYIKRALEFLGVARERKGQLAHANAIYQEYLEKYPDGEDAIRVEQRIAGIMSMAQPKPGRRKSVAAAESDQGPEWAVFGGFSQFYRYADLTIEEEDTDTLEDSLRSDLDLTARVQTDRWDFRSRLSGGYVTDLQGEPVGDDKRLSDFYVELRDKYSDASFRLGRQNSSKGGVLGRFDGFLGGAKLGERFRLNLVTGYAVDSSRDVTVDTSRYFYGLNMDFSPYDSSWQYNAFVIEQKLDGRVDRRGVGGEIRYFDANKSVFALVDYDIEFDELNTVLLIGNMTLARGTNFSVTADYRNSPTLTLRNALSGQQKQRIEDLLDIYTEEELRQFALDRTAKSEFINAGVTQPLSDVYQLTANVSMTNFSSTPESGGVPALEGTGDEFSYDIGLIANSLFMENDTSIFSLRYFDGERTKRTSFSFDSRYPLTRNLRLNPRIRVDFQDAVDADSEEWRFRPSLRMDYRWRRRLHLELEIGGEWTSRDVTLAFGEETQTTEGYYVSIGYRLDF